MITNNMALNDSALSMGSSNTTPLKFRIDPTKTYKALNPSSSTEISVRSDILRDFETGSERETRIQMEAEMRDAMMP